MASDRLKTLYRQARKAHVGMIVGESALSAWSAAKTLRQWECLEALDLVDLEIEPDEENGPDNFVVIGRYRRDPGESRWHIGDTIGGCEGYSNPADWRQNDYVLDIMDQTIAALRNDRKRSLAVKRCRERGICPWCNGTGRSDV